MIKIAKLKALELFAGIGGIALAEQMAGIEVAGLCEYAEFPRKILNKNFPKVPVLKDVKKINSESLKGVGIDASTIDIISGGFPCQPFSIAGKRQGTKDDRDLWPEMFRIIQELEPTWVVGENVANFANMELDRTLFNLESAGYETRALVLPACAVGAFHQRKRTFIVAHANRQRWGGLDKSQENRCVREFAESFGRQTWQTHGNDPHNLLLAGAEKIAHGDSRIQRNDDGLSTGVDRLKALGNAVVPQQVLPIFKAIVKIEELRSEIV